MIKKFKKGFSLVELLVVIAIIGILAAVGITAYSGYTADAKVKASTAQHSQVVALLNAEMARCASGKGDFAWENTGDGGDHDECNDNPRTASIVSHFALDGKIPLKNPYKDDVASVDTRLGAAGTATHLTAAGLTEEVSYLGRIAIFCGAVSGEQVCIVRSETGEQEPVGDLVKVIKVY